MSLNWSYTQYWPTAICGHVAAVFVCANYLVMHHHELVLQTMNLTGTGIAIWLSNLMYWNLVNSSYSQFHLPTPEVNKTEHNMSVHY